VRIGEEGLARHRKEFGRVLGGIGIEQRLLLALDHANETRVRRLERALPDAGVHVRVRHGEPVGLALEHVDLVGELVDHDVVSGLAAGRRGRRPELDVLPRERDRPAGPRLARELVVPFVHHAVLVQLLPAHPELAGVDDDAHPAVVEIQPEIEDRQARLQRDRDPDRVGQLEAAGRGNLLLVQEQHHQLAQAARVVGRQAGEKGQLRDDAAPESLVDGRALDHALAAPGAEHGMRCS
jgi:hypothetical protein